MSRRYVIDDTVFKAHLDATTDKTREIHIVGDCMPYVWIGSDVEGCYGCIPDKHVRKFRDALTKALRKPKP